MLCVLSIAFAACDTVQTRSDVISENYDLTVDEGVVALGKKNWEVQDCKAMKERSNGGKDRHSLIMKGTSSFENLKCLRKFYPRPGEAGAEEVFLVLDFSGDKIKRHELWKVNLNFNSHVPVAEAQVRATLIK